jgi:hypothetical protein
MERVGQRSSLSNAFAGTDMVVRFRVAVEQMNSDTTVGTNSDGRGPNVRRVVRRAEVCMRSSADGQEGLVR